MLNLKPPFLQSGKDMVIFRDDTDEHCFYYLNQQPRISCDAEGNPMISAYSILPESGADLKQNAYLEAGMSLQVDLAPTQDQLDMAEKCIQEAYNITPKRLVPAPFHSGKVRFLMAQADTEADSDEWFVTSEVTPSMVGTNNAALVVRVNGPQAKLLLASLQTGAIPASVYYEMEMTGMTPVYHAEIRAEMRRIYEKFRSYKKTDLIFYKKEIEDIVENLEEGRDIYILVEETDPDIKATAMATLKDQLLKHILDSLFEPVTLQKQQDSAGVLGGLIDKVSGLVQSMIPGYCNLKSSLGENIQETWSVNLNERDAKTTPVCPQSPLGQMIKMAQLDMSKHIQIISLDQLPIFSQPLNIRVSANTFENSNINSLVVQVRVRDTDTGEIVMYPESNDFTKGKLTWDLNFNRKKDHHYAYEYQVMMYVADTDADLIDTEEPLTGADWQIAPSSYIYINPASFYRNLNLDLNIGDFTVFDFAGMIRADVDIVPKGGGDSLFHKQYQFTEAEKNESHKKLNLLVKRDVPLEFRIHLTYDIFAANPVESDFTAAEDTLFVIKNPFVNRWHVDLICFADWDTVRQVNLDTRVLDPARPDPVRNHFTFKKDHEEDILYASVSLDAPARAFEYQITRVDRTTPPVTAGWYSHGDTPTLFIDAAEVIPERVVRFKIQDPESIQKLRIRKPKVIFKWVVDGKENKAEGEFSPPETVPQFICPAQAICSYQLVFKNESGLSVVPSRWQSLPEGNDLVTLNVSQLNNG